MACRAAVWADTLTAADQRTEAIARHRFTIVALSVTALLLASPAAAIDLADPSLFGPGEGWPLTVLQPGDRGPWVAELQRSLDASGFRVGEVDGVFGTQTIAAVHAFEKLHDLPRDARFSPEDWERLGTWIAPPGASGEPERIEVDLERQILYLIADAQVVRVLPVSSGNGEAYVNSAGNLVRARTPEGRFEFNRQRSGWHESYLGFMYAPFYFRGGYAIHGSSSVPAHPASHGCVRVTIGDMDFLRDYLRIGMPVYIYGNRTDRAELLDA